MMNCSKSLGGLLVAAGIAGAAVVQVTPATTKSSLPPLKTGRVTGTVLSVYNSPATFEGIKRGLNEQGFRLLRFPNGSMSNWYHWNSEGKHDSEGIWRPDPAKVGPGFLTNSRYRGTTQVYSGAGFQSRITDGIDTTFWWSDPTTPDQPLVQLDFTGDSTLDSVRITWGALRPDSVLVAHLQTTAWNGYAGADAQLVPLARVAVTGANTSVSFPAAAMRFLAIKPLGVGPRGVQIAEIEAWRAGALSTSSSPDPKVQTPVVALGAHQGSQPSPNWPKPPAWDFATYVAYYQSMKDVEPLICVNYGTGTPEEAAAWVKYANVDLKLGIKFWEIGNEMDGVWEDGGPVSARQYAARYLAFARAMKAVDPSIQVFGPVLSTSEFATTSSYQLDGTLWTEEVLRIVGEAEVKDGTRYLDGFDFHAYPYWTDGRPNAVNGLTAVRNLAARMDTLLAMMGRRLQDPGSRLINMSELNMSVVSSNLLVRAENAVATALSLAQLVHAAGGNAMSVVWEGYNGGSTGGAANGATWGSLSLFNEPRSGIESSERFVPSASYWGNWAISRLWAIDSAKPLTATVTGTGSSKLAAFGLVSGADTSWLLMNTDSRVCTTKVAGVPSGWVYTFSGSDFTWNGTNDQAFAFPNAGPSGKPVAAGWDGRVVVPALGMAVVRTSAPNAAAIAGTGHLVNMTLRRKQIEITDTIRISGTWLRGLTDAVPTATIADTTIALTALDGAWDSHEEGFVAAIPASAVGIGDRLLRLGSRDSVVVEVTGVVRPNVWIDRFLDVSDTSEQASKAAWSVWQAGTKVSSIVKTYPVRDVDHCLRMDVNLTQPATLGYGVFGQGALDLDSALVSASIGITFQYASAHGASGTFSVGITTDTVTNYDDYTINLAKTDSVWKTVRVLWKEVKQAGWSGVSGGPLQGRLVNTLNFRITGEGTGSLWIDNIALLGTTGDSVVGVSPRIRRVDWNVVRAQGGWQIQVPAGARLWMVGLDGRRQAAFAATTAPRTVRFQPSGSGLVYAVLEAPGRREVKRLPAIR